MSTTRNPTVVCLCPTYHARPASLVGNSIACFEAQTYRNAVLVVYDDTGHFNPAVGPGWVLVSNSERHPTLSAKYNHMVRHLAGRCDILVTWEDDDIYLPWHIEASVAALQGEGGAKRPHWSHPSKAWALTTGKPILEAVGGNMHASAAMWRDTWERIGGWPETLRADFDLQLLSNLRRTFGSPGDPIQHFPPSYMFRWGSTGTRHGQSFGSSGADEEWYQKAGQQQPFPGTRDVVPAWDEETARLVKELSLPKSGVTTQS